MVLLVVGVLCSLAFQGEIIGYRNGPLLAQLYPSRCHVLKLSNGWRRRFAKRERMMNEGRRRVFRIPVEQRRESNLLLEV